MTLLPDGNCARLSADSTAIEVGDCKGAKMETVVKFSEMRSCKLSKVSDFQFSPDYARVLLTPAEGDTAKSPYYIYKIESKRCDRLSDNLSQSYPLFSPDGKKIAYVRDNNVIIKRLEYNTDIVVTTDGSATLFNGARDRNFSEAFAVESTMLWAPTSDYLLFSKADKLYMYSIQYKWTKEVKLPDPDAAYITAVEWSTNPEFFGVAYLNRSQTKLQIAQVNAATFVAKNIYEYTDAKFIEPECATFFKFIEKQQNLLVLRSESGRRQIYQYSPLGKLINQVTTADVDVTAVTEYDSKTKRVTYNTYDGLVRQQCSVQTDGKKPLQLTDNILQPSNKEYRKAGDLNYYVLKPTVPNGSLIMYVSDFESDADDAFETIMAGKGYMVAVVKTRGTDGQGKAFRQGAYLNMLNAPAEDYITVAKSLIKTGEVSQASIIGTDLNAGVALSAILTENNPFSAAVAVSPVTDLRAYNYIETERVMRTEGATKAYALNSAVDNARKLEKKLLILHSMSDSFTPVRNTEELCNRLVSSGIQFDMQLFFDKGHQFTENIDNEYLITKITNYLK